VEEAHDMRRNARRKGELFVEAIRPVPQGKLVS